MNKELGRIAYEAFYGLPPDDDTWEPEKPGEPSAWGEAARAVEAAVRSAALEEAAKIAEEVLWSDRSPHDIPDEIRAAKEGPTPSRPSPPSDEAASSPQG
jgi:hypothetical protein